MLIIDKYAYNNRLRDFNPFYKILLVAIGLLIATSISNNYINIGIFVLMVFLTTYVAAIPFGNYLKILIIPMSFLFISIIAILLSVSDKNIYIHSLKIGRYFIGVSKESILTSLNIITRVLASMSLTFFLSLTTPLNNLIRVFNRMKLPSILIELIVLTYRFIFIFLEESINIQRAQEVRFGYIGFKNKINSIALLIRSLFIRVFIRYREMVNSLDSKLYNGEFKVGD